MQRWLAAVAVGGVLCGAAVGCSSEVAEPEVTSSTTVATTASSTTTSTTEATTTTLSEAARRNADIDAARAEIVQVVEDWVMFPVDSDLGEAGSGADLLTGRLRARRLENFRMTIEAEERLYARGNAAVQVLDLRLDFDAGTAEVDTCFRGDLQRDDADGVLVGEDEGLEIPAEFVVVQTERGWKIEEVYFDGPDPDRGVEGELCAIG